MADILPPDAGRPYATVTAAGESDLLALAPDAVAALYKAHGALLLRGFGTDLDQFRRFAEQFCAGSALNDSRGRDLLDPAHKIQSVNRGVAAFPLHPELSREPWKPDVCFFGCLGAPSEGGATTICDGVEIVAQMPAEVRAAFEGRRLLYLQAAAPEELDYWLGTPSPDAAALAAPPAACPYRFSREDGMILRAFSRPALHKPMFADALAFGNFLFFARYCLGIQGVPVFEDRTQVPDPLLAAVKMVADRLTVPVQWQAGDVLMLDNSRFMHGRTAVRDTNERLIASYFGYLDFAVPDAEEPAGAPWRAGPFNPPARLSPAARAA